MDLIGNINRYLYYNRLNGERRMALAHYSVNQIDANQSLIMYPPYHIVVSKGEKNTFQIGMCNKWMATVQNRLIINIATGRKSM